MAHAVKVGYRIRTVIGGADREGGQKMSDGPPARVHDFDRFANGIEFSP
jgi:hypothetical protein